MNINTVLNKIDQEKIDKILGVIKIVLIVATFLGFWDLLMYTIYNRIPFPLSISHLAPALLVIMFMVTGIIIMLILALFFPSFFKGEFFGVPVNAIYVQGQPGRLIRILRYVLIFGLPLLNMTIGFFVMALSESMVFSSLPFIALGLSLLLSYMQIKKYIESVYVKSYFKTVLAVLLIYMYWSLIAMLFTFAFVPDNFSDDIFFLSILPYSICLVFCFFLISHMFKKVSPKVFYAFIPLCSVLIFVPEFNARITGAALKAVKLGGGIEAYLVSQDQKKIKVSHDLIDENDSQKSKLIYIMLDMGDLLYVKLDKESDQIYGEVKKGLSIRYKPKVQKEKDNKKV